MRSIESTLKRNKTHLLPVKRTKLRDSDKRHTLHTTTSLCGFFIGEVTAKFIQVPESIDRKIVLFFRRDVCLTCSGKMLDAVKSFKRRL